MRSRDQYNDFCVTNHLRLYSKKSVEYWVVKLANMGKSHGSILSSVSAVKFFCTKEGKKLNFATARLKLILRGIKNSGPIQRPAPVVSYDQLVAMVRSSRKVLGKSKGNRFAAMITCAFFGFLRPSEYCITSSGHELKSGDIDITDSQITLTLTTFKHSKGPAMVRIHRVAGPACPVYRVSKYLKVRCKTVNTFFHVSYKTFCDEFARVAVVAGLQDNVTPHALRRGGATWASLQGWSDSRIRAHGRWSSGAFKKYIVLR